jgi:hypothetical protein
MWLMTEDERREIFIDAYSEDFLRDTLRTYKTVCSGLAKECNTRYERPEAYSVFPMLRRAELEKELAVLCETRYPFIKAVPTQNRRKSSWYRLFQSKGVLLTVSALAHPRMIARPAAFREEYATTSQANLQFDEEEVEIPDIPHVLYAILGHGASKSKVRPWFIDIKFPDQDCKKYVGEIKLLEKYPQLVSKLWPVSTQEVVQDELAGFGLRADAKAKAIQQRKQRQQEQGKQEDKTG